MRKRIKRWVKRLLKTGGLFVLIGFGVLIGIIIGSESASDRQTVIIRSDYPQEFGDELAQTIEQQVAQRVEERIEERIVIPPIPTVPPFPEMPAIPEIPNIPDIPTKIYIDHQPSFFEVVNGIGTILASLGLIGLGLVMVVRGRRHLRREPKEKSPKSLNL